MNKQLSIPERIVAKVMRITKSIKLSNLPEREIADSHFHFFGKISTIRKTVLILKKMGIRKIATLNFFTTDKINILNLMSVCFKKLYPDFAYIMAGLTYPETKNCNERTIRETFCEQTKKIFELGFDGIKIIETKPTFYKKLPYEIDNLVYNEFFEIVEKLQLPIIWHVADPEEYWKNQYSNENYPSKKYFYEKIISVLERFSKLKVIFAHFLFLSKDFKMASHILEKYPEVSFDITPGIEMYHNFSHHLEQTRDFFNKYQDRILFGSDNLVGNKMPKSEDLRMRIFDIRIFLETDKKYKMFGQPVQGIKLSSIVLEKIYLKNFIQIMGEKPRSLNISIAREEALRAEKILREEHDVKPEDNIGYQTRQLLEQ